MKAQRRLGLAVGWLPLTVVFLIDVAIMVLVSNWPGTWRPDIAWWVGIGVAAVLALMVLLAVRGVSLSTLVGRWVRNFFTKVEPKLAAGRTAAIDHHRRYGHATVGVREYRGGLVAVVAVATPVEAAAGRHSRPDSADAADLPVQVIADGLQQFDVHLDEIDILTVATTDADTTAGRPGAWLVLRMNPQSNVGAIAVRDSVASTVAAAAERIADDLGRRRFDAWPLTADEIGELDTLVLAGLQPADSRVRLRFIKQRRDAKTFSYVTSFWVSPKDIDVETFDQLAESDTDATVVTVRLRQRHGEVQVSAWVRQHSADRLAKKAWKGLNRLTGQQLRAVSASLPVPSRTLTLPSRALGRDEDLSVPLHLLETPSTVEAGQ